MVGVLSGEQTEKVRTTDPCAACGSVLAPRTLERYGGIRMMLCRDFTSCNRRSGIVKR